MTLAYEVLLELHTSSIHSDFSFTAYRQENNLPENVLVNLDLFLESSGQDQGKFDTEILGNELLFRFDIRGLHGVVGKSLNFKILEDYVGEETYSLCNMKRNL